MIRLWSAKNITLTFSELEKILWFELIELLKKYKFSWIGTTKTSPTHVWKGVWCSYGYQVDAVDLEAQTVKFYKV